MESDSLYRATRDKARSLKKYGSTCNHVRNTTNDALIKHVVEASDTLQGIALKYGTTTEQIRRTNRLYASDSLFSKPYLMIPVSKGSPFYPTEQPPQAARSTTIADNHWPHSQLFPMDGEEPQRNPPPAGWDPLQCPFDPPAGTSSSHSMEFPSTSSASPSSVASSAPPVAECLSPDEEHKRHLDELLGKIDSTIANSRRFVAKSQDSSEFVGRELQEAMEDEGDILYDNAYQNATSTTASHMRSLSSGSGNFHTTDDTSNLITNSRQVKSSLRRLEQTQDELFEL